MFKIIFDCFCGTNLEEHDAEVDDEEDRVEGPEDVDDVPVQQRSVGHCRCYLMQQPLRTQTCHSLQALV